MKYRVENENGSDSWGTYIKTKKQYKINNAISVDLFANQSYKIPKY